MDWNAERIPRNNDAPNIIHAVLYSALHERHDAHVDVTAVLFKHLLNLYKSMT